MGLLGVGYNKLSSVFHPEESVCFARADEQPVALRAFRHMADVARARPDRINAFVGVQFQNINQDDNPISRAERHRLVSVLADGGKKKFQFSLAK